MKARFAALAALLVLVVAAPASAALPKKGTYKGKSSQGLSVTIKVNQAQKIKSLKFLVKNDCGATKKPIEVSGPFTVKQNGNFSAELSNGSDSLNFSGHFGKKGKLTGKVRERTQDPLLGKCDTGKVTFSAQRS